MNTMSAEQWEQAREQMMNPEALQQQANMLKNMDKATVRRMAPQFANMSDAQIDAALAQMQMMASNPAMLDMARQQMSNMSHEQAQAQMAALSRKFNAGDRVKIKGLTKAAQHNGKFGSVVGMQGERYKVKFDDEETTLALKEANLEKTTTSNPVAEHVRDPEAMRQQARMLRSVDPATLRASNPQFAHMNDDQIRAAADQLDLIADNPAMFQAAQEQMQNMSPEQIENIQNMMRSSGGGTAPMPTAEAAAEMMQNMDGSQLEGMLNMVKQNPEIVKQMMKSNPLTANMSPDMVDKQLDMLNSIPPEQLKKYLGYAAKAQKVLAPVANVYTKADRLFGGRLKHLLFGAALALLLAFIARLFGFFRHSPHDEAAAVVNDLLNATLAASDDADATDFLDEDEFADLS